MRIRFLTGMFLLSMLLQGCTGISPLAETAQNEATVTSFSHNFTATSIPTVANTPAAVFTDTLMPTLTRTASPTITSSVSNQVTKQACIPPVSALPDGKTYTGKLILSGPRNLNDSIWSSATTSFFDLKNRQIATALPGKTPSISVSPDRTKYAAVDLTDQQIKVFSNNGQLLKALPKGKFGDYIDSWLGNEYIALVVLEQETSTYLRYPMEVVIANPFTNEQKSFSSLYSDIDVVMNIFWEGISTTKYDPQITRVVYAAGIENDYLGKKGKGYILWDMEKQEKLVQIVTAEFLATPKWAPDGLKFVINDTHGNGEFYLITRDGAVTQLSLLNPLGQSPAIRYYSDVYSWSPDGQYLAFWRELYQDEMKATFAIINTVTGDVTDYCISAGYLEARAAQMSEAYLPVWSPDGKFVAVIANGQVGGSFESLLIDLEEGSAAKIGKDMIPVGWLVNAP